MPTVVFSPAQRRATGGVQEIEIEATRVDALIEALETRFPALAGAFDGLAVAIDGDIHNDPRYLALAPQAEVHFVAPIAGGDGTRRGRCGILNPPALRRNRVPRSLP